MGYKFTSVTDGQQPFEKHRVACVNADARQWPAGMPRPVCLQVLEVTTADVVPIAAITCL